MTIVGVSGSPIVGGNTDRIIKAVLEQSGKDHLFINLSTLRYDSCRACAHLCASTGICPLDDDLKPYFEPIRDAEALVLGTAIHAGYMTGWMFSFTTRLSCFSHVKLPLRDKPVVLVVTGCFEESEKTVPQFARNVTVQSRGARVIGHIFYASSRPPCSRSSIAHVCKVGGLWYMLGRSEEKLRDFKLTRDMFKRWEDCPETVTEVARYAQMLSEL